MYVKCACCLCVCVCVCDRNVSPDIGVVLGKRSYDLQTLKYTTQYSQLAISSAGNCL